METSRQYTALASSIKSNFAQLFDLNLPGFCQAPPPSQASCSLYLSSICRATSQASAKKLLSQLLKLLINSLSQASAKFSCPKISRLISTSPASAELSCQKQIELVLSAKISTSGLGWALLPHLLELLLYFSAQSLRFLLSIFSTSEASVGLSSSSPKLFLSFFVSIAQASAEFYHFSLFKLLSNSPPGSAELSCLFLLSSCWMILS